MQQQLFEIETVFIPIYRWRFGSSERLHGLPRVTQPEGTATSSMGSSPCCQGCIILAAMLTAQLQEKLRVPGLAISILYNLEELSSCFLIDKKGKKKKKTDWNPLLNFSGWLNWHSCLAQKMNYFKGPEISYLNHPSPPPAPLNYSFLFFTLTEFLGYTLKSPWVTANLYV